MNKSEIIELAKRQWEKWPTVSRETVLIVDWSRPAQQHRLFEVDLQLNAITYSWWTSHGSGSGPLYSATKFSDIPESRQSELGALQTAELYQGKYGLSLKLDGLEKSNKNVRRRAIVIHPAPYVDESYVIKNGNPGRSWGCVTTDPKNNEKLLRRWANGTLLYLYFPS